MLNDDTLKALIEAIIYVSPEPVTLDAIVKSLEGEERERVKPKLQELLEDFQRPDHGIQIRQVAGGYQFSSKPEHHDVLRRFVKSLKSPIRLSRPALETLAVIAYRQPVTLPEIDEIRGVDCGGVVHTLMEKKLVVTAGRKSVVGRPILYRTSRDFLVHFGLKDVNELPSLKEFEELARQALGAEAELSADVAPSSNAPASETATGEPAASSEATSAQPTPGGLSRPAEAEPGSPEGTAPAPASDEPNP
jgi:segregation and condensation protein B